MNTIQPMISPFIWATLATSSPLAEFPHQESGALRTPGAFPHRDKGAGVRDGRRMAEVDGEWMYMVFMLNIYEYMNGDYDDEWNIVYRYDDHYQCGWNIIMLLLGIMMMNGDEWNNDIFPNNGD